MVMIGFGTHLRGHGSGNFIAGPPPPPPLPAIPPHAAAHFWDFSDASSVSRDGASRVTAVNDQIGGQALLGGTAAPFFVPSAQALGGPKARIRFSEPSYLEMPTALALDLQSVSVFCVHRQDLSAWSKLNSALITLGLNQEEFILMKTGRQALEIKGGGASGSDISNSSCASVSWGMGGTSNLLLGSDFDTWEKGSAGSTQNAAGGYIGAVSSTDTQEGFLGDMQAVLIYDKTLTLTEKNEVLGWLSGRYGTPSPASGREIIFDGDGLTAGQQNAAPQLTPHWADLSYPTQMQLLYAEPPRVHNCGMPDFKLSNRSRSREARNRLAVSRPTNDRILFALIGHNDIADGVGINTIRRTCTLYMLAIKRTYSDIRIGFGTLLNTTRWSSSDARETTRLELNDMIRGVTSGLDHDFHIDTQAIPELQDPTDTAWFTDGIHLTTAGYGVLAAEIKAGIDLIP